MKIVRSFPRKVREIENVWIPLSDGCRLAARIWLPEDADTDPVPAILEYLPYRKRDFTRIRDEPMHHYFAGHGYAGVRVDLRGSGDSDGVLLDEYLEQEHDDALEVIRWIASQRWCSGAVGMIGISWGGFNSLQVAARRPPELKAVITLCSTDDRYADDAHYMGGCLLNENLTWGSVLLSFNSYPPDPEIVGERWRAMWLERLEGSVLFPALWLEHQQRDDYWRHGSVCEDFSQIECPVYAVGGWADGYSNAVPRLLAGLDVPRKGLVGPWAHVFPYEGVPGPAIGFLQDSLRWWDHWLKDIDTGLMDEPMYRVWMQDSTPPRPYYEERPGRWIAEASWPSPRVEPRSLSLNPGRLSESADPETALEFRSPQTAGFCGGDWCAFGARGELPRDQREDDGKSLCFDSEPLEETLEILGAPVVRLELAVDRPCAFVCARLCDVAADGASTRVTYGLLNLTHREGHETPRLLVPGQRYAVDVQLNDAAHSFAPGHSLRLALSTSYWPTAWPSPEPVTLTVFSGASGLELPVRPASPDDERLAPFEAPERAPASEQTPLRDAMPRRVIERDLKTGEALYTVLADDEFEGGAAMARVEAINLDVGYSVQRRYRIREIDPLSARAEVEQKTVLRRGAWSTRVVANTRCTATRTEFRIEAELTAFEGDTQVFARTWDRRIKREGL